MNHFWSENVQGVLTLYLSRKLRFHDIFKNQYTEFFNLDSKKKLRILEIGCGPGALAGALHRWYPEAEIVGMDRDSKFIAFAKENEPEIEFLEGDAASLPFENGSFDVTISNTVSEHIEPSIFYSEQKRVLKKNGVCLVLSARKGITLEADCMKETPEEQEFWETVDFDNTALEAQGVGKYWMSEQALPAAMEKYGFSHVTTGYAITPLTPDNPAIPRQVALEMIDAKRKEAVEIVMSAGQPDGERICGIINRKFEERLKLLQQGEKQWDTDTAITMILRGINA